MTQRDYILSIAENVGRALAQIIYDKEIHEYQGALSLIDELASQLANDPLLDELTDLLQEEPSCAVETI